ncbi:MAG: hypothetical protein LQ337_005432 [Flavoplaca oasis]|nr:MAG: hypothetical protein LQ337_005432 [Flavoplaca oasis]
MQANRVLSVLVLLASYCLFPFLDASILPHEDPKDAQTLNHTSSSSITVKGSTAFGALRDGTIQSSDATTVHLDLVPVSSDPHLVRPRRKARTKHALEPIQRRYNPFTNLVGGGRITWNALAAITPSVYAAYALKTLFTMLYDSVIDSWSHQPPREIFHFNYGGLRLSFYRRHEVIPWAFVADVARKMGNAVERGLLAFLKATCQFAAAASVVFTFMAVGLAIRGITSGTSSTSYPGRPSIFEIEE